MDGYYLYGHSAGAQFVHRHLAFIGAGGNPLRVIRAVAANAGFYTVPDFQVPFPFGFGGTESVMSEEDLRNYLQVLASRRRGGPCAACEGGAARCRAQAPLAVVLGEQDNDPFHKHLNRSERAMEQGPHRLARGRHFFEVRRKADSDGPVTAPPKRVAPVYTRRSKRGESKGRGECGLAGVCSPKLGRKRPAPPAQ